MSALFAFGVIASLMMLWLSSPPMIVEPARMRPRL